MSALMHQMVNLKDTPFSMTIHRCNLLLYSEYVSVALSSHQTQMNNHCHKSHNEQQDSHHLIISGDLVLASNTYERNQHQLVKKTTVSLLNNDLITVDYIEK